MKNFKTLFLAIIALVTLTISCYDSGTDPQDQPTSQATITALEELTNHFNENGTLNNQNNPTGNIIFDYCFNFVYPLNLIYNNGTQVTVNSLDELASILVNATDTLYIANITFPFNVEVQDPNSNGTIIQSINNEDEFAALIDGCDFGDTPCTVTTDINPVCVSFINANGDVETVQFQNWSYADCEGFDTGDVIPCTDSDCELSNLVVTIGDCNTDGTYNITVDVDYTGIENTLNVYYNDGNTAGFETYDVNDFPITIPSEYLITNYIQITSANTSCEIFEDWIAPSCNSVCWSFIYPMDIMVNGVTTTVNNDAEFDAEYNNTANQVQLILPFSIESGGVTDTITTWDVFENYYGGFDNRCD